MKKELKSIEKMQATPTYEMLYERHNEYHPQKLKINVKRSLPNQKDMKIQFQSSKTTLNQFKDEGVTKWSP